MRGDALAFDPFQYLVMVEKDLGADAEFPGKVGPLGDALAHMLGVKSAQQLSYLLAVDKVAWGHVVILSKKLYQIDGDLQKAGD